MLQRFARKRLNSLRRAFGQTRWARTFRRSRRARLNIPAALLPDPALLPDSPQDLALPSEVRDARLLTDAIAWSHRKGPQHPSARPAPRGIARKRQIPTKGRPTRNVLLISHCDFTGNSALHTYRIALELHARGYSPIIAVPGDPETVKDLGRPPFAVVPYRDSHADRLRFPDGRGPDLVHAFTPRERVRKLASRIVATSRCPFVVHLEDNDRAVLSAELERRAEDLEQLPALLLDDFIGAAQVHPLRGPHFVEHASGITVVIDRLLELAPTGIPAAVVSPGFDEAFVSPDTSGEQVRVGLGIRPDDHVVVYTGTIHTANVADMQRFYDALAALRRAGHPIVFVKTGWNAPDAPELEQLGDWARNLGWLPRAALPGLLAAADVLVQPGVPGPFNDYRFPAKLPDFLASGKPVILSRTNIGLALEDRREALVLENGTSAEIQNAVALLRDEPELARQIGEQGREFALRELRWAASVDSVESLYEEVAVTQSRPISPFALELDPPVRIIAVVLEPPDSNEARLARRHGVHGFCFPLEEMREATDDFPFCLRIAFSEDETIGSRLSRLSSSAYITVGGAPLLVCDDSGAAERWRGPAEREAGRPVHFALVESAKSAAPGLHGFDSLVEPPDVAMWKQLAVPLPEHAWFRSVALPEEGGDTSAYQIWLRKLVLQALGRASAQEPLIFADPSAAWAEPQARTAWLNATRSGLDDGVSRFYASRRLDRDGLRRVERAVEEAEGGSRARPHRSLTTVADAVELAAPLGPSVGAISQEQAETQPTFLGAVLTACRVRVARLAGRRRRP
jgi:glycosyltransferase involved in cell wall biosynthesis